MGHDEFTGKQASAVQNKQEKVAGNSLENSFRNKMCWKH